MTTAQLVKIVEAERRQSKTKDRPLQDMSQQELIYLLEDIMHSKPAPPPKKATNPWMILGWVVFWSIVLPVALVIGGILGSIIFH